MNEVAIYMEGGGKGHNTKVALRQGMEGVYHKIRHASDLLKRIDSSKVRDRCPSCERLFDVMIRAIQVV